MSTTGSFAPYTFSDEDTGPWAHSWFNNPTDLFIGQTGGFEYSNALYMWYFPYPEDTLEMSGHLQSTLTWRTGSGATFLAAPTYVYVRYRINAFADGGAYGVSEAQVGLPPTFTNTNNGLSVEHRAVKREVVTNGSFTTPLLSLFSKATPSGYAQSTSTYVGVSYEVLPYPILQDLHSYTTYSKGPNGERVLNKPAADGTVIHDRAIKLIPHTSLPVYETRFPVSLHLSQAIYDSNNIQYSYNHSGPHSVPYGFSDTPSPTRNFTGVGQSISIPQLLESLGETSVYEATATPPTISGDPLVAKTVTRWHYPTENAQFVFDEDLYVLSSVVWRDKEFASYGQYVNWTKTIHPLWQAQILGGTTAILGNPITSLIPSPQIGLILAISNIVAQSGLDAMTLIQDTNWAAAWANVSSSNGAPVSTFAPSRTFDPEEGYIMYPLPYELLEAKAFHIDNYSLTEGFMGVDFIAYAKHAMEIVNVGNFVSARWQANGGGSGGGTGGTGGGTGSEGGGR